MTATNTMAPTTDATWRPRHNPWLIAAAVTLAAFMEILEVYGVISRKAAR
jgi:DHA2 family multidrug resistance protein